MEREGEKGEGGRRGREREEGGPVTERKKNRERERQKDEGRETGREKRRKYIIYT